MPIEIQSMQETQASDQLRLALVGSLKSGKSRLASTGRKNVLFFDADQRWQSVAGIPGVYTITFKDKFFPNMPDAAPLALDILTALEKSLDLHDLSVRSSDGTSFRLNPQPPVGTIVHTIVNDSLATLADMFRRYEMAMNKDLRREISIGVTKSYFPNGWDTWNAETSQVIPFILRQFALPNVDVIAVFHERLEQAEDSTDDSPKYTGKVSVHPPRYAQLLTYFNEVWRVRLAQKPVKEGNSTVYKFIPRVYPTPDSSFNACTAMMLDSEEEPNIEQIIAKHRQRRPQQVPSSETKVLTMDTSQKQLR